MIFRLEPGNPSSEYSVSFLKYYGHADVATSNYILKNTDFNTYQTSVN